MLGGSPWREETDEDVILKYSRALSFEEAPDYARWKDELRALVPEDLPDNAVYVPGDRSEPRVGKPRTEPIVTVPEHDGKDIDEFSDAEDEGSLPDSDDRWVPTSSWAEPYSIRDVDLVGDEANIRDN